MKYVVLFLLCATLARATDTAYEYKTTISGDLVISFGTNSWALVVHGADTNDFQHDSVEETLDYAERLLDCHAITAAIEQCILAQRIINERVIAIGDVCGITFEEKQ